MSAKRLKSTALPSITGFAACGPDVAEAEHGGAVGHDRHEVLARGVEPYLAGIRRDLPARRRDARRVGEREVELRRDRLRPDHLDLSGSALRVVAEGVVM